ncbi:hypothetical protein EG867_16720, partial [Enterococcus faecalis]
MTLKMFMRNFLYIFIFIFLSFFILPNISEAATSVSQYGITWNFDGDYPVGQYANGDYWVVGPVRIISITPDFDGSHHGWMVNMSGLSQGYDSRSSGFNASLVPSLPYSAQPGDAIIKAVSIEPFDISP